MESAQELDLSTQDAQSVSGLLSSESVVNKIGRAHV